MSFTLRAKRMLVTAATGALVLSLFPAATAFADTEAVCENAPDAGFSDSGTTHGDNIDCMSAYGIGQGYGDGTYGTFDPLTRGQAASLLYKFAQVATDGAIEDEIDATDPVPFTDMGTTHAAAISALYRLDLVQGTTTTTYSPNAAVTRAQYATILYNAHVALGTDFEASYTTNFTDIEGSIHADAIAALEGEGVISGTTATTYTPAGFITRGANASLLALSAGLLDDAGNWMADRLAAPTNQTFMVTSADAATLTAVANPETPSDNTDDRQFSVSNPVAGATHTIALFPAANVTVDSDTVTFKDADSNNVADGIGAVDAWITVVNGAAVTADTQITTVMPSGGTITFTVDGDIAESVVPVVFADADSDGQLDLTVASPANANPKTPSESFGIGGETTFQPAEAAAFSNPDAGTVIQVDTDGNWYTLDNGGTAGVADVLVNYVAGDTFTYSSGSFTAAPISMAQFETYLSVGDTINPGVYNPGATSHDVATDIPAAPTGVTANYRSTTSDVRVTWTKVANPDVVNYQVRRATVSAAGVVGVYGDVGAAVAAAATAQFDDTTVAGNTTYAYQVVAINTATNRSAASNVAQVSVPAAADILAPTVSTVTVTDQADSASNPAGVVAAGDQIAVTFSEAVTVAANTQLWFLDADGTVAALENGANATFVQNSARTSLFISVTASPTIIEPGGTPATALTLAAGASPVVVNSTDVADDSGNALAEISASIAAPSAAGSPTTFTVTFDSPVDAASVSTSDFTAPSAIVSAVVAGDGLSVVVTVTDTLVLNDTVGIKAQSVTGEFGGNGPAAAVTVDTAA